MRKLIILIILAITLAGFPVPTRAQTPQAMHASPAPLYRDPVYDGAADPVMVWNRAEHAWWMLYTQRRANVDAPGVAFCYGTAIGVASSDDHGKTWVYRGKLDLDFESGMNTFWAPDVVYQDGTYHLFCAYIRGVRSQWGGEARIAHYTSRDLWHWKFEGFLTLGSGHVIDPALFKKPDGEWGMWYKDEDRGTDIMEATSHDLFHWKMSATPAIIGKQEGPVVFRFGSYYWMLTDEWAGMRVYRSEDLQHWTRQGRILSGPSPRREDRPSGAHGDVVVQGDRAYIFYFTHPGRKTHTEAPADTAGVIPYNLRRSSIQVAPLQVVNGTLVSDREDPFDFWLQAPAR
jgi:hypothetical protein